MLVDGIVGKDTWGSLGLIYRTKQDIDVGVEIVTEGLNQFFDVTVPVNSALRTTATDAKKHYFDFDWFESKVNNNNDWDVKLEIPWKKTIKTTYPGKKDSIVYYYRMKTSPEGIGNMMYGYTGTAAGFPDVVLYGGGGMVQQGGVDFIPFVKAFIDGPPYWGDTREDHIMIKFGILLYEGGGPN